MSDDIQRPTALHAIDGLLGALSFCGILTILLVRALLGVRPCFVVGELQEVIAWCIFVAPWVILLRISTKRIVDSSSPLANPKRPTWKSIIKVTFL